MKEIKFNLTAHRNLWDKIIKTLENDAGRFDDEDELKSIAFAELKIPAEDCPVFGCYACQYVVDLEKQEDKHLKCDYCPLIGINCNRGESNLWDDFCDAIEWSDYDTAIIIAKDIRDAKVKTNILTK